MIRQEAAWPVDLCRYGVNTRLFLCCTSLIIKKERDHYAHFVSEEFESYLSRKEHDGVHGNNPEIQAASELFNRPIEVYVPEKGSEFSHPNYCTEL